MVPGESRMEFGAKIGYSPKAYRVKKIWRENAVAPCFSRNLKAKQGTDSNMLFLFHWQPQGTQKKGVHSSEQSPALFSRTPCTQLGQCVPNEQSQLKVRLQHFVSVDVISSLKASIGKGRIMVRNG